MKPNPDDLLFKLITLLKILSSNMVTFRGTEGLGLQHMHFVDAVQPMALWPQTPLNPCPSHRQNIAIILL